MSVVLAIDTAAPRLQLGLRHGDGRTTGMVEALAQGHAERLFPCLDALLAEAGLAYGDLDRVAVTTGPGSFTGLRIGLSAARGLGLALDIPVLGIPGLLAVSLSAPAGPVAVLLDARRGEAYLQLFSAPGIPAAPPALLAMAAARAAVPAASTLIESPFCDIERLADFAAAADPAAWPPEAAYLRAADAKPQEHFRIARK